MIAYVLPNEESKRPLNSFAVSVDKVEKMTGIDFFSQLPDDLERVLEADTLSHVSRDGGQISGGLYRPTRNQQIIAVIAVVVIFLVVHFLIKHWGGKKKKKKPARKPAKKKK